MRKLNKLVSAVMVAATILLAGCSEKDVPAPTAVTERLDDLRNELRDLRLQVYGEQWETEDISAENASLEKEQAELEAEILRLKELYKRKVVLGMHIIDFQNNKLANATVTMAQDGELISAVSDESGYVEFPAVHSGMISGVVEMAGYTTANFRIRLVEMGADDDTETHKFSRIALFPTQDNPDKTGMFTLNGNVYANFSTLNDNGNSGHDPNSPSGIFDPAAGRKLRFSLQLNYITHWSTAYINIHSVIYENIQYETTTAADGSYEIQLPSRGLFFDAHNHYYNQFGFLVLAEEFQANYTYHYASDVITEKRNFSIDHIDNCYFYDLSPAAFPGDTRTANFLYHSYKN